jgi:hypothetical protein
MKTSQEISQAIERELLSWPGVTMAHHRFGGRGFHVGKLEIGHLHGSKVADIPFPKPIRDELVAAGKASVHEYLPNSGWVSVHLREEADLPDALALFRQNYERIRALAQHHPQ